MSRFARAIRLPKWNTGELANAAQSALTCRAREVVREFPYHDLACTILSQRPRHTTPAMSELPDPTMDDDPAIFFVVDQGTAHGPYTYAQLDEWRAKPFDALLDTVENRIHLYRAEEQAGVITLNPGTITSAPILEMLRVLAERPGRAMTARIFQEYSGRVCKAGTFAKYIQRLRELVSDEAANPHFILTRVVDSSVSDTTHAYCANPDLKWRVIRYSGGLSSSNP